MMGYGYGYGPYGMMGGWGWLVSLFFGLIVLVGIVLLVIWAVRAMSGQSHHPMSPPPGPKSDEACEIARVRYAKGEITKEQYDEICKTLGT